MITNRSSGILAHITSLPSPYGIGDIGPSSYAFVDFLVRCEQSCWQFLPTCPTIDLFDNSPYMSTSAFAGSSLLISPDLLFQEGLLSRSHLESHPDFSPYSADFAKVRAYKDYLLNEAYLRFRPAALPEYHQFIQENKWLDDYAMFMALKESHKDIGWFDWPSALAARDGNTLGLLLKQLSGRIDYFRFEQFEFFRQWQLLRQYASDKAVQLFGDLPIYVSYDSVDVWAHQDIFALDRRTFRPTNVSGVPPDYFSRTGQKWGNPLYDWQNDDPVVQKKLVNWWADRLSHLFKLVDMVRIDHFRGFESYWAIPEKNPTAENGVWCKGPGKLFFENIAEKLGVLNIVAEDLGIITPEVEILRDELGFPGMKVLQFAFDGNPENSFLPHNFTTTNCIVYTGTHDNETTVGWFLSERLDDSQRATIKRFANRTLHDRNAIHDDLIYLAQSSIAALCIFPLQDVLGFGNDCKMNSPGVPSGNWRWRCAGEFLTEEISAKLQYSTRLFSRGRTAGKKPDAP
jgi:4-alpha-glucanotransferase